MKQRIICKSAGLVLLVLAVSACVGASPSRAQAPSHIFDPVLSVTGGCTVSPRDLIPDPPRQEGSQEEEIAECEAGAHPSENLQRLTGVTVDSYGNLYVANQGPNAGGVQSNPHINVFDPESNFIAEIPTPVEPESVAVDGDGYLYVYTSTGGKSLLRYDPAPSYDAAAGVIAYEPTPTVIDPAGWSFWPFTASLAVNPENDHLFVSFGNRLEGVEGETVRSAIVEFGSAAEGSPLLDDEVAEVRGFASKLGLAIDASRGRIYASDQEPDAFPNTGLRLIRVFELAAPHNLIATFDGSSLPEGTFVKCGTVPDNCPRQVTIGADESTGNLFVYDIEKNRVVYELDEDGKYLATIDYGLQPRGRTRIAVDNGENSPNGALNPEGRYLWLVENPEGIAHADAFKPTKIGPPAVEEISFSNVNETEALLEAEVDPNQAETSYRFEYVSKAQFEASGFDAAQVAGEGTVAAGTLPVSVFAQVRDLSPGSSYVFRVVAENEASPPLGEAESEFSTYREIHLPSCPNEATRTGSSAALPDCRAYELVTPPNTGGRPPLGLGLNGSLTFPALPASPAGDRLTFRIENGLIPGLDGTASITGDPYLSTRGPDGWETVASGASGTEAEVGVPGGRSPDQTVSVWAAEGQGSAVIGGERTIYVRYPDGHSELLGQGSLGTDPEPNPKLVAAGGAHMLFTSSLRLEEAAPPSGLAVYDRTPDGITHVVSLLPGDQTPSASQQVIYSGSSLDGRGVAFEVTESGITTLYLRRDNQTTYPVGPGLTFEGVAEGGARIFYLQAGNLKALDAETGDTISFASGGDVTVVNVSADGSTAYLVSPDKLTANPNPLGDQAVAGKENLYRSREGTISFVATVSTRDVEGEGINLLHDGLGLWVSAVTNSAAAPGNFASDPSRSTADGSALLFQSDSDLTGYETEGSRQVYRYDAAANQLACLSCNPTGAPPSGDALLQNVSESAGRPEPNTPYDLVLNLAADGRRAFFQSPDPLVAADTDGLQDVYEWEAQGVGSCGEPGGCVYLISSGRSEKVNYLYAASASGNDVFFRTTDLLVPADKEPIPSIYDARVGGGFAEEAPTPECDGEGCRPLLSPPPALPIPASSPPGSGNVKKGCPKGKRRVKRAGKIRCVKKHKRHRHADTSTKGGRK